MALESLETKLMRYLSYNTQADPDAKTKPSNPTEKTLGQLLVNEMQALGCVQVGEYTTNGGYFVMGKLKSNITDLSKWKLVPAIGFIAHLDTSFTYPYSKNIVKIHTIEQLYQEYGINLRAKANSEGEYENWLTNGIIVGEDIGSSIGIKNKAGIAEIMGMLEYLYNHPEIPHGKICICFTSDAELGRAMDQIRAQGTPVQATNASNQKLYYNPTTDVLTTVNSGPVEPVMELNGGFDAQLAYLVEAEGQNIIQYNNYSVIDFEIKFKGIAAAGQAEEEAQLNAIKNACIFVAEVITYDNSLTMDNGTGLVFFRALNGDYREALLEVQIKAVNQSDLADKVQTFKTLLYKSKGYTENYVFLTQTAKHYNVREKIPQSQIDLAIAANYQHYARATSSTPIKNGYSAATLTDLGIPAITISSGGYNFYTYRECIPVPALDDIRDVLVQIVSLAYSKDFRDDFPFYVSLPNQEKIYTKSLLHFDNAFSISDPALDTANEYVIETPSGTYTTEQKKFGAGALKALRDTKNTTTACTIKGVVLGNQTFTIDFWFYATGIRDLHIFEHQEKIIHLYNNEIYFNNERIVNNRWVNNNLNKWVHVAYVYNHEIGLLNFYINGKNTASINSRLLQATRNDLKLLVKGPEDNYDQYIDEFRLSIGTCRWKEEFTPPTSSYNLEFN